jgi:diguanylate cyclase (GGDEF)-like protein
LWKRHGREVADKIVVKLCGLLAGKIRGEESIIQLADGRIAIISPTAGREQCVNFAGRVCKALAAAHLSLRGERVETTVSAGVAAVPDDGADTPMPDLLRLATSRLDAAVHAGGNQVVFGKKERRNSLNQEEFIERMRDLLASASPEAVMSCTTWLNSICSTCRDRRKAGKSSPCISGDKQGICGRGTARC